MSCPYYWYNYNSYACRKSGKDVNSDVYYKYCRNYDYGDCPVYKGKDASGCFLTSACVNAKGLPDDCKELTVLRAFRDGYMKSVPGGEADICQYYHIAPAIVDKINTLPDAKNIYDRIYTELVLPCVEFIQNGDNEAAYTQYRNYVEFLRMEYLKI